jgi:hypothetical protein
MASPALLDIEVDSSLSAQENANRYFSRFKKLARQANHVEALLDQTVCCRMLPYAAVCCRMLPYAAVCCHMLPYAHVCSRMLTYVHVCSRTLTYAHVCSRMLTYAVTYALRMLTYAVVCRSRTSLS